MWVDSTESGIEPEEGAYAAYTVKGDYFLCKRCYECNRRANRNSRETVRQEQDSDKTDLYITVRENPWAASAVYGFRVVRTKGPLFLQFEFAEFRLALSYGEDLYIAWRSYSDLKRLMNQVLPMCLPLTMAAWALVQRGGAGDGLFPTLNTEFLVWKVTNLNRYEVTTVISAHNGLYVAPCYIIVCVQEIGYSHSACSCLELVLLVCFTDVAVSILLHTNFSLCR
jgi:hypothetical protein